MTVGELIEKLQKYPADATIENADGYDLADVSLGAHITQYFKDNRTVKFPYVELTFED